MKQLLRFFIVILAVLPFTTGLFHICLLGVTGKELFALKETFPQKTSIIKLRGNNYAKQLEKIVPLTEFPADLVQTVLFAEDLYFYRHSGFSIRYIEHAITLNNKYGYTVYGGSTITQQLARTLFLNIDKNYLRKYLELVISIEMEFILEKNRILELYLNYIELGPEIYGFPEAAEYYFNKRLMELTTEEKLSLISIMPSPLHWSVHTFKENNILLRRYYFIRSYYQNQHTLPPRIKSSLIEKNKLE
ncbi:MAG: transglycosylase domain-containing protein [Spirochaetales bacterium]|nr:transglycosylase domain-containing protein [Spirochaetales bacterium]